MTSISRCALCHHWVCWVRRRARQVGLPLEKWICVTLEDPDLGTLRNKGHGFLVPINILHTICVTSWQLTLKATADWVKNIWKEPGRAAGLRLGLYDLDFVRSWTNMTSRENKLPWEHQFEASLENKLPLGFRVKRLITRTNTHTHTLWPMRLSLTDRLQRGKVQRGKVQRQLQRQAQVLCCSVLQWSALQRVAVRCSMLQCVATCSSALQCMAACYSALQRQVQRQTRISLW